MSRRAPIWREAILQRSLSFRQQHPQLFLLLQNPIVLCPAVAIRGHAFPNVFHRRQRLSYTLHKVQRIVHAIPWTVDE